MENDLGDEKGKKRNAGGCYWWKTGTKISNKKLGWWWKTDIEMSNKKWCWR